MIYSIVPTDVVFFDNTNKTKISKMYNNAIIELIRRERIISTNQRLV